LLLSKSVISLAACLQHIFQSEPRYSPTARKCAALHSGNTFQERLKAAVLVIVRSFSIRKIRVVGRLVLA
jgi:hypothetical protein